MTLLQPVKCVTDKAYGWMQHLCPFHTSLEFWLLPPAEREKTPNMRMHIAKGQEMEWKWALTILFVCSPTWIISLIIGFFRVVDQPGHTCIACGTYRFCSLTYLPVQRVQEIILMECLVFHLRGYQNIYIPPVIICLLIVPEMKWITLEMSLKAIVCNTT